MDFYGVFDQVIELLRSRGRVSFARSRNTSSDDDRLDAPAPELLYAHPGTSRGRPRAGVDAGDPHPATRTATTHHVLLRPRRFDALASRFDPEDLREIMRVVLRHVRQGDRPLRRPHRPIPRRWPPGLLRLSPRARGRRTARRPRWPRHHRCRRATQHRPIREARCRAGGSAGVPHRTRCGRRGGQRTRATTIWRRATPPTSLPVCRACQANALVIGALTHQLLGGLFKCRVLGHPRSRALPRRWRSTRCCRKHGATRLEAIGTTGLTPLVGRATELRLLEAPWAEVVSRPGARRPVNGEAGIGKSRLLGPDRTCLRSARMVHPFHVRPTTGTPHSTPSSICWRARPSLRTPTRSRSFTQIGRILRPERSAAATKRTVLLLAALHSAWRRIRFTFGLDRGAAEATDHARPDDDPPSQSAETAGDASSWRICTGSTRQLWIS